MPSCKAGSWPHCRRWSARASLPPGLDFAATEVAPPRDAAHGELASNAAMVLAKPARMKPRDIAEKLAAKLAEAPMSPRSRSPVRFRQPDVRAARFGRGGGPDPQSRGRLWTHRHR